MKIIIIGATGTIGKHGVRINAVSPGFFEESPGYFPYFAGHIPVKMDR
jgi:hypothetical protein